LSKKTKSKDSKKETNDVVSDPELEKEEGKHEFDPRHGDDCERCLPKK